MSGVIFFATFIQGCGGFSTLAPSQNESPFHLSKEKRSEALMPRSCVKTLRSFGAKGDGQTDDSEALRLAFRSSQGCVLDGQGVKYVVSQELRVPEGSHLLDFTLDALPQYRPDSVVINIEGVEGVEVTGVRVGKRDSEPGRGHQLGDWEGSAIIQIARSPGTRLNDIEVSGDGAGSGLRIMESHGTVVQRATIHHLRWYALS